MNFKIGHGYDVHRLALGRKLIIGGVEIPHETGLDGHSDADVVAHAVTDSLLGAAGLGDIGKLFPDTDEQYRGADSIKLLSVAVDKIYGEGYKISNIDITIVAQSPKMQQFISAMCYNISKACKIDVGQVNVKATTEEKMGFTGRSEGISAYAVCLIFSE